MQGRNDFINTIIAGDDLHWDHYDNKYIALSMEEIDAIIIACTENDIHDEHNMMKVINWCTSVRVGNLLMKNFLEGKIRISCDDESEEPEFSKK
jgi:hypothetical protein